MIVFAAKRHMARNGSGGRFAAYVDTTDGPYLGDVGPYHASGPKRPVGVNRSPLIGWWAHPAGQHERLPLLWPTREAAGEELARRAT